MTVAVSKVTGQRYPLYVAWLSRFYPDWAFLDMEVHPEAMARCDALVLVGGPDVDPCLYGKPDATPLCTINPERDALEFSLVQQARQRKLPILGICRGLQLAVVALGGTLVPDLPSEGKLGHHISHPGGVRSGKSDFGDPLHPITIAADSWLASVAGTTGTVNSSHHQAVADPGPLLRVTATSAEGVVEAVEWKDPSSHPPLLLVQWHPERMDDLDSPLSGGMLTSFFRP